MAVLLAMVTIAVYWPATDNSFVNYDDDANVTSNLHVQTGLSLESLKWALCNPVNCDWQPVTVWSHMLDCQVFGLNPWGHHLTSVLLHAANTLLVFLLFRGLTGALWRSALLAALFGLHPQHVESVAWVAERKDVLSGFFGLLALVFYVRYAEAQRLKSKVESRQAGERRHKAAFSVTQPATRFYLLSIFLFALGLLSKQMLVTWPFVMLLLDYWPLKRLTSGNWPTRKKFSNSHSAVRTSAGSDGLTDIQPAILHSANAKSKRNPSLSIGARPFCCQ